MRLHGLKCGMESDCESNHVPESLGDNFDSDREADVLEEMKSIESSTINRFLQGVLEWNTGLEC